MRNWLKRWVAGPGGSSGNENKTRVVILGAGFGGSSCARTLTKLGADDLEVIVIDRNNYMLYFPLLIESVVGSVQPQTILVPFRSQAPEADLRAGEVKSVDFRTRHLCYADPGGHERWLHYDELVFALGSTTRMPDDITGIKEHAYTLKSEADSIAIHDQGIRMLEYANDVDDLELRRALLTFVVIGGNFTGIELAGEFHAFMQKATRNYSRLHPGDIRVVVIELTDRILSGSSADLAEWIERQFRIRGIELLKETSVTEIGAEHVITTSGRKILTRTPIWAAGIAPNPLIKKLGLTANAHGYIDCHDDMRVRSMEHVWAIGDSAQIGESATAATAQNATREGPLCAMNILRVLKNQLTLPFSYSPIGNFATIGYHRAAAQVYGRDFHGFFAWLVYRSVYLMKMPTLMQKLRLIGDWVGETIFATQPVPFGHPVVFHKEDVAAEKRAFLG